MGASQIWQIRLICHLELRRRGGQVGVAVWDFKKQESKSQGDEKS